MRFLHLADLHIGKVVNGFSMLEDQRVILKQVADIVREYGPQAVAIAGDVYDKPVPPSEAVSLFSEFLTALAQENTAVLLISGNHDSPERLGFAGELLARRGVHISGVFDGTVRKVYMRDGWGEVAFYLLPFLRPSGVRRFFEGKEIDSYTDAISAVLQSAQINREERSVLVAHQYFLSPKTETLFSESEIRPVGGLDAVDASLLEPFCYTALGHLHGPQLVGTPNARYAGSPLKYSFSECLHRKSVVIVDIDKDGGCSTELVPLRPLRDLRKIRGELHELLAAQADGRENPEDYLHVTLTDEPEPPDALDRLRTALPNIMALEFDNARTAARIEELPLTLSENDPLEMFSEFFRQATGSALSAGQTELVRELLNAAEVDA